MSTEHDTIYGEPIMRPTDIRHRSVLVEGHSGIRHRVTQIDTDTHNWAFTVIHLTPIDTVLPVPCGNARGTRPTTIGLGNIIGLPEDTLDPDWRPSRAWRILRDPHLCGLDTAAYRATLGPPTPGYQWREYRDLAVSVELVRGADPYGTGVDYAHIAPIQSIDDDRALWEWLDAQGYGTDTDLWARVTPVGIWAPNNRPAEGDREVDVTVDELDAIEQAIADEAGRRVLDVTQGELDEIERVTSGYQRGQVTFPSIDMAELVADIAGTRDGCTVHLDTNALETLAAQPEDCDGHYDGRYVWVGGTEYEVEPR